MTHLELTVTAALLGGFAVWTCGMFAIALMRAFKWRKQARLSAELQPAIRQELVAYLSGADDQTKLKEFCRKSRRDVADALISFQGTVGGGARDRLCEFSIEQTLIHDWCSDARTKDPIRRRPAFARLAFVCAYEPCRRVAGDLLERALNDADPEVRFYAWRSLVQSGSIEEIEKLFDAALSQSLLIRILLTEELRRFAVPLCERAVMKALNSADRERVLACLEMLVAWERAVPVPDLHALIESPDRRIRIQALRLASLVPLEADDLGAIVRALVGDDFEAATAAAVAVGRLRFEQALPGLARCLRSGNAGLARAAAEALAQMPPTGWTTLEEMAASSNPITAGAAGEALDGAQRRARV
jgi:HEAT repeat protein